jgi:hypothetical protein
VSDTGELGTPPADDHDIVDRAGIGAGLTPGDLTDGELQEQELEQERESWGDGTDPEPTD